MKKITAVILLGLSALFGPLAAGAAESSVDENAQYFASLAQQSPEQLVEAMRAVCEAESKDRLLLAVERAADHLVKEQKPDAAKRLKEAAKEFRKGGAHGCRIVPEPGFLTDFLRPGPVPSGS